MYLGPRRIIIIVFIPEKRRMHLQCIEFTSRIEAQLYIVSSKSYGRLNRP